LVICNLPSWRRRRFSVPRTLSTLQITNHQLPIPTKNPSQPGQEGALGSGLGGGHHRSRDELITYTTRVTFAAWKPLGPFSRSNSTVSPSLRVRYPFSWMAEKWTNTSSPVDR